MGKIKIGLIGCGRISKSHVEALAANRDLLELAAVSDIIPERMEAIAGLYAEKTGLSPTCSRDYSAMLADHQIGAVTIATESGLHAAIALNALAAGKHVLVEKPMALSIQDCDAMIELASSNKLKLAVCHQNRFNPAVVKLRSALEDGRFGRLINGSACIRWNRNESYYSQAPWRGTWAMDGGTLMNQCLHNIDLLQWMLGEEASSVYCQADTYLRPIEGEDFGAILLRFKNGSIGTVEGSACVYPTNLEETLSLFGETGTACLGGVALNKITQWRFPGSEGEQEDVAQHSQPDPKTVYGSGHTPLYRDFYDALSGDAKPMIDGQAGKKAVEIILAAYKSRRDGVPVQLPLEGFSTLDMLNK